jgi:hypothetical protein
VPTKLVPSGRFGTALELCGDELFVGMPGDDKAGLRTGSVYVFSRDLGGAGNWGKVKRVVANAALPKSRLGTSVAAVGDTMVSGAASEPAAGTNTGAAYIFMRDQGGANQWGQVAKLQASALSPVLTAASVEGQKDGLFFYGTGGRQANPWGSGTSYVCVIPPRLRGGLMAGNGTPGGCDGSISQDLNARWCAACPKPAHNPGAGAYVQTQLWYRDPQGTSNQTSSMSDALEFYVLP